MRNCVNAVMSEDELYRHLLAARTDNHSKQDVDIVTQLTPVLNAIVGKQLTWTSAQCKKCFHQMLNLFSAIDVLPLLLASSGLDSDYSILKNAATRRSEFGIRNQEHGEAVDPKTLEKRENTALKKIAHSIYEECDDKALLQIITGALSFQEIKKLELEQLSTTDYSGGEQISPDQQYKRTGIISNIGESDGCFVGRDSVMYAISDGFALGYKIQLIGGGNGSGKSRLALEYARVHRDEYQIICWIDAWNEDCIIGGIIQFFNVAELPVDSIHADTIRDSFLRFFEVNANWLIVFDNAELSVSLQKEIVKRYLPNGDGHVIITGNFGEHVGSDLPDSKYHLLDYCDNPGNNNDGDLLLKKALSLANLDIAAKKLLSLCGRDFTTLTLMTSFIRQSEWIDCDHYLKILGDYGIDADISDSQPVSIVSLEIIMSPIRIKNKILKNPLYSAIEQAIMLFSIIGRNIVNLNFLSNTFKILPDSVCEVYSAANDRKKLESILRSCGIIEIQSGVYLSNSWFNHFSAECFSKEDMIFLCKTLLEKAEKEVRFITENPYIQNPDAIFTCAKPYLYQLFSYLSNKCKKLEEIKSRYPRSYQLLR